MSQTASERPNPLQRSDLLVSKGCDNFQSSSDGRKISLESGNLAIVETFPALKSGDVGLIHLRRAGDINMVRVNRAIALWFGLAA
jgi:hypothetical protein